MPDTEQGPRQSDGSPEATHAPGSGLMERRQFRRAELEAPVELRSLNESGSSDSRPILTGRSKSVSLGGCYSYIKAPCPLKRYDEVVCSIAVPPEYRGHFPFTRVLGRGWVVRVESPHKSGRANSGAEPESQVGVIIAFTPGVTALGTI